MSMLNAPRAINAFNGLVASCLCRPLFQRRPGSTGVRLLIIQCDSGHVDGDLVACARYRIYDERAKGKINNPTPGRDGNTHVLFIIHLPRQTATSSFVGYQGDPWISTHIDALRSPTDTTITLFQARKATISSLFYTKQEEAMDTEGMPPLETESGDEDMVTETSTSGEVGREIEGEENEMETDEQPQHPPEFLGPTEQVVPQAPELSGGVPAAGYFQQLHFCIQAAASKLQDSEKNKGRSTDRVDILVGLIPRKLKHLGKWYMIPHPSKVSTVF